MSRNEKLRTRITAILLAFVMAASLLATGIGIGADVKAATEKTVEIIYTGTDDTDLYLDCYDNGGSSWVKSWNLFSQDFVGSSDYFSAFSKTVDSKGYTHFTVTFDSDNIYNVGFQLSVNWKYIEFTEEDITNGDLTRYVDGEGNVSKTAPVDMKTVEIVYTGTDDTDLYLDCYDNGGSSWVKSWNLLSESYVGSSDYFSSYSKTVDSNGYTHFTVAFDYEKIYNVGFQLSVNWAYVEFTDTEIGSGSLIKYVDSEGNVTTTDPSDDKEEETDPTPDPEPVIGTTTFIYTGSRYNFSYIIFESTGIAVNGDWPSDAKGSIYDLSVDYLSYEVTEVDGMPAIVISADTNQCTEGWFKIYTSDYVIFKEGNKTTFANEVYYVNDDSTVTTEPPAEDTPVVEYTTYTATIHVYGQDANVGGWYIYAENGTESDWTGAMDATGALSGDWGTATLTYSVVKGEKEYNGIGVQLIENGTWLDTKYKQFFDGTSCEMWIVPEAGTCYDNEADALAAAADPATSSKVIVHYKTNAIAAWVVGSWFTTEVNGSWGSKDTAFTYQDDWGYVAVVEYDEVVNSIAFKIHQRWNIDGVNYDWYKEEGSNRIILLSNGFAEVWLTKGSNAILYTCPDGATVFDEATATSFRNYRYIGRQSAKGEDAELVFHYFREDGVYDDWTVGIWAQAANDTWKDAQITQNKELDEYGAATYTVDLSKWPKTEIGFAVNYNNWEKKDYEADRYVDVSKVEAGQVLDVYIYENDGNIYFEPRTAEVSETDAEGVDADVVFHYSRTEGDYEGWMVGLWCEKADGTWVNDNVAFDGTDADGLATVTVDLSKFPAESLGFKINKDNWASEDGGDRSIDLTDVTDGQIIDVYIYEGDGEVYFEPKAVEEPVEVVTETDVVEEPVEEPVGEETKGGCAGCTGCTGCAVLLPVFAIIIAGALFIFKKRA